MNKGLRASCLTAIVGALLASTGMAACSKSDHGFESSQAIIGDAGDAAKAEQCLYRCSLDGRSVVDTCSGDVVQTCADSQACGAGKCQEPCAAATAERSSNGCEFFLQPPVFTTGSANGCYAAFAVNTSNVPAELSLDFQGQAADLSQAIFHTAPGSAELVAQTGPVAPGESVIVFLAYGPPDGPPLPGNHQQQCPAGVVPPVTGFGLPNGTGIGSSFNLRSSAPVSLAAIYPFGGATSYLPSATLLLPVGTWSTQNIIVNAWERITDPLFFNGRGPAAQIVASEDGTSVTIQPTNAIQDGIDVKGTAAHVPATYHLDKGQVLQINQAEELSGSIVTSDKPTSVFGGHECMFIPSTRQACDTALQQLPPFSMWGSEYVGVGYRPRRGDPRELVGYRIVAARDGTQLDYDPVVPDGAPLTMSAGQVVTFWSPTNSPFTVRSQDAEHAFYLAAYMSGGAFAKDELGQQDMQGAGDPEFVNVIPTAQFLNSYSFYADPTYDETSLVVVRAKTDGVFKDVWLECAGNLTNFQPVGARGDYEWARVDLARGGGDGDSFDGGACKNGLQRMKSDGAFSATLWGWAPYASYAYPGGMAQRPLVKQPLPTVN